MMEPAGGPEKFLEEHALIVCSDHSQSKVEGEIDLFKAFDGFGLRAAQRSRPDDEIAVCPNSRAAQVYILDRDKRRSLVPRVERTLLALEGVDLVMRMGDHPDGEAIVRGERSRGVKEVRFAPRGDLVDARGVRWSVEGDLDLLGLKIEDDQIRSSTYPDALSRVWSALRCPTSGEVLASARPGYEFLDWGGAHHVGGGSHGSLHANDSNAVAALGGHGRGEVSARAVGAARHRPDDPRPLRDRVRQQVDLTRVRVAGEEDQLVAAGVLEALDVRADGVRVGRGAADDHLRRSRPRNA